MEEFAIGANFEGAAARRNEGEGFNPLAEFENLGRQTDSLRRVVSNHAILNRYFGFHLDLLSESTLSVRGKPVKNVRDRRLARSEQEAEAIATIFSARGLPRECRMQLRSLNGSTIAATKTGISGGRLCPDRPHLNPVQGKSYRRQKRPSCAPCGARKWPNDFEWRRALRPLPLYWIRRQNNMKRRQRTALPAIYDSRQTTARHPDACCGSVSRLQLVQ